MNDPADHAPVIDPRLCDIGGPTLADTAPLPAPPSSPAPAPSPAAPMEPPPLTSRVLVGLGGIFLSSMLSGLNSRAGSLGLADIRGSLGFGLDDASWLNTVYAAGELVAMPFTTWFAVTFTVRRFHLFMISLSTLIAILLPLVINLNVLLVLRAIQGVSAGSLIPLLMMMALRVLPSSVRLHGLALYALTSTFSPNLAIWIVGQWTDVLDDWRLLYWQFIPVAIVSASLVGWALPREAVAWKRFSLINLPGLLTGMPGLFLLAIALDQGSRLDWFHSPLICTAMTAGVACLVAYGLFEWFHPAPFIKFQLLSRRNLGIGFTIFIGMLIALMSGSVLPSNYLATIWGYRALQSAPIGLIIALPQVIAGSLVAILLYQKWVDARLVLATGLCLIGLACFQASHVDTNWIWEQFIPAQLLHAAGQPMAVVSMLFLSTSVVQPMEGPYIAGFVNTLRDISSLVGGALVARLLEVREHFHSYVMVDRFGAIGQSLPGVQDLTSLSAAMNGQVVALATADVYRVLGVLALVLVPLALMMQFIPAPGPTHSPAPPKSRKLSPSNG